MLIKYPLSFVAKLSQAELAVLVLWPALFKEFISTTDNSMTDKRHMGPRQKNTTKMTNIPLKIKNISSFYNFSRNASKLTLTAINVGEKKGFL